MILGVDAISLQGGGIVHLKNIIINSNYSKFNKIIIWGNKKALQSVPNNKKIIKIHLNIFEKNFLIVFIWKLLKFSNLIKKKNCNCMLYLSGYYFGNFKPSVIFMQNMLPFEDTAINYYNFFYRIKFKILKYLSIYSLKKASHVVFPSKYFKNLLKKKIRCKSSFIYHGGTRRFRKTEENKTLRLVYVSSFEPFKNHINLLMAIYNLSKFCNISLDLYGPKNYFFFEKVFPLIKKINLQKKIIFYKGFKNSNYIYKNYNLSIYPSVCESFGLPIAESIASNIPVACSNIPVFKEIFKKNVLFFNPKKIESIQNTIFNFHKNFLIKKNKYDFNKVNSWKLSSRKIFSILEMESKKK